MDKLIIKEKQGLPIEYRILKIDPIDLSKYSKQ